jgi:hypothetical protein
VSYYLYYYSPRTLKLNIWRKGRGLKLKAKIGGEGEGMCHTSPIRKDPGVAVPDYGIPLKFST